MLSEISSTAATIMGGALESIFLRRCAICIKMLKDGQPLPFGLILGISQEWAEQVRRALLEFVLTGWMRRVGAGRRRFISASEMPKGGAKQKAYSTSI